MNKKGTDKIISVYWFTILFIVAAAVVYMVFIFYGQPYDIRELEAKALTNQIADCFSYGGYLIDGRLEKNFQENFMKVCNLNFNTEDIYGWREQDQYYIETDIINFETKQTIFQVMEGNLGLKELCNLNGKNLPLCLERSFYTIDENNNQYQINILSVIRKTEKNAQ